MAMVAAKETLQFLILVLSSLSVIFITITSFLVASRIYKNHLWERSGKNIAEIESFLLDHILNEKPFRSFPFPVNKRVQYLIISLAKKLRGSEKRYLQDLYRNLGYFKKDLKNLDSISLRKSSSALARCRVFEYPLSEDMWFRLINHKSEKFRWAAMEYLVVVKRHRSLAWIGYSLKQGKPYKNGVLLHILSTLAEVSPNTLLTFLQHSDSEWFTEQILRVFAAYPQPRAESFILHILKSKCSDETFIAGIKSLSSCLSKDILDFFKLHVEHKHWVVRLEIAKALLSSSEPENKILLHSLSLDPNYLVRRAAIQSLMYNIEYYGETIDEILFDSTHPSHSLLVSEIKYSEIAS